MIEVRGLSFTYAGTPGPALEGIDLDIPARQFCAVVGANGAGKSTLCYALSGFIPHFFRGSLSGRVLVGGRSVPETPLGELAGEIGLVFANPFNQITGARFSVLEEVAFGLENLGVPREEMVRRCQQALEATGLGELGERSPFALSGGQQQRLAIAAMLAMRPRVLILDEPTSQLDPAGTEALFARLNGLASSGEMTIILTEHKLEWVAAYAHRVLVLAGGRLVADGPPREVFSSASLEEHGVLPTRYTQAARGARQASLAPADGQLPVTLEQAVEYLR